MSSLKLTQANEIISVALAEARKQNLKPLAVAVLDPGGHLIALQREDGATFLRVDIAIGKAWGALGMGFGTRELVQRAENYPTFVTALGILSNGRMVPSPGGVLILNAEGELLGGVGISGDAGDNDEACALAGIKAAGLAAMPGSAIA